MRGIYFAHTSQELDTEAAELFGRDFYFFWMWLRHLLGEHQEDGSSTINLVNLREHLKAGPWADL